MVLPMRSKALFSKPALVKSRVTVDSTLPMSVAALADFELSADCDRCGRHLQLYPGPADFHPRTRLVSLLHRLNCRAQRNGRPCDGQPRRLILARGERRWVLDQAGTWVEDDTLFWESRDFDAMPERRKSGAHPTA